jgi:DNA-binding NtrC family response regulator
MDAFVGRHWEGNVREMENMVMQGILFSTGDEITSKDVGLARKPTDIKTPAIMPFMDLPYKTAKENNLKAFNAAYIGHMLTLSKGNVTQAAKACGLERQALQQIMRRYGITAEPYRR